jgi:hypothetical protein
MGKGLCTGAGRRAGSWGHFYSLFYFFFYHLVASGLCSFDLFHCDLLFIFLDSLSPITWDIVLFLYYLCLAIEKEVYRMPLKTVFSKWRNVLSNRTDLIKIWTWPDNSISIMILRSWFGTMAWVSVQGPYHQPNIVWQPHRNTNLPETNQNPSNPDVAPSPTLKLPDLLRSIARNRYLLRSWSWNSSIAGLPVPFLMAMDLSGLCPILPFFYFLLFSSNQTWSKDR